jgi:hypothetical protein
MQAKHECGVERDVHDVRGDRDDQRRPGVLQAAQYAGAGENGEHGRSAEQADAQVDDRLTGYGRGRAEGADDLSGERQAERDNYQADCACQPDPVDALADSRLPVAGAELPGDRRGCAVRQEDRDVDQRGQRLSRDAEPAERSRAEPADDGRVREQEQRLGDERA